MEQATIPTVLSSSVLPPCSPNEIAIAPGDCVEGGGEEWFEDETGLAGFRVWQLVGLILSVLLSIIIGLCCCIRFRIPRTKQEIEADYIRKKITKNFQKELSKISNIEMDKMDLQTALDRIQNKFESGTCGLHDEHKEMVTNGTHHGLRARFNAMFGGIHIGFAKKEHKEVNNMI